jgi:hypothetical protein
MRWTHHVEGEDHPLEEQMWRILGQNRPERPMQTAAGGLGAGFIIAAFGIPTLAAVIWFGAAALGLAVR